MVEPFFCIGLWTNGTDLSESGCPDLRLLEEVADLNRAEVSAIRLLEIEIMQV